MHSSDEQVTRAVEQVQIRQMQSRRDHIICRVQPKGHIRALSSPPLLADSHRMAEEPEEILAADVLHLSFQTKLTRQSFT